MNRVYFFLAGLYIMVLSACSQNAGEESQNDSLAKSSETVIYEVSLEVNPESTNWMGNIDQTKMLRTLFSNVENGKLQAYGALDNPDEEPITWNEVLSSMDANNDTISILNVETGEVQTKIVEGRLNLNEIKSMIFIEDWSLGDNGQLIKNVLGIAPVRHYYTPDDSSKQYPKKRIPFVAYYGDERPELFENY